MREAVDLLIEAGWVVPVEPEGWILTEHTVAVRDGRIEGILPWAEAREQYQAEEVVQLPNHMVTAGLVNAHTHSAMSLLRGFADDLPLMTWLNEHIWPAEGAFVGPDFVRDGTELAIAEMLRGGTTCFNDMYFFPDVVARTASRAGMRASVGMILIEFPSAWAEKPEEYLSKGLQVRDDFKADPLISFVFAPHAPYTVSDASLERMRGYADELDTPIHMHLHETAQEVEDAVREQGERPIARMARLGLLSPSMMAVHMTQLSDEEIRLISECGASVLHCPESNLKLASGFCPVARLQEAGVNLGLGTDGAASNNDLDMIGEMRTAALLAKTVAGDASALPAGRVLTMATLGGAQALGLDHAIGSLKKGKWADIMAVDMQHFATQPVYNPVSQLVYAASRDQVSDVWVAGRRLLQNGRLTEMDESAIQRKTRDWAARISRHRDQAMPEQSHND
ncbi:5-methylthioadenosine/S-adenosylhomocysteine deaminase [Natronospira proteinivora]|uniref:5-methylthioadenosine/S-adenosylhomocysteine deaminase n=1 Tax=Natronospira proteinivora TaxID=1807133 RepID=A0ABT1GAI4_9GAMM|nr:TRZ/ATZ family hydrolase [Natronospira proteinivora]MCP1726937.1 5-methylthioadenosine/S-adenosylhomocysteine deaminase [Natronospira proteinivora]